MRDRGYRKRYDELASKMSIISIMNNYRHYFELMHQEANITIPAKDYDSKITRKHLQLINRFV
jgi:hypothetical protein